MKKELSAHEIREVAVRATVDPRTVKKHLEGGNIRPMAKERIEEALEALGYVD